MEFAAPIYIFGDTKVGKRTVINHLSNWQKRIECFIQTSALKLFLTPIFINSFDDLPLTAFGALVTYDITNKISFESAQQVCNLIKLQTLRQPQFLPLRVLVGTHRDKSEHREVSYDESTELKLSINALWFEVSPSQNLDILYKQLCIRAIFSVKSMMTSNLPILPRGVILEQQTSIDSAMLPRNYEQRLCQLYTDEDFLQASKLSRHQGKMIETQARDHIQESHFFYFEDEDNVNFDDPFVKPNLKLTSLQKTLFEPRKSTIDNLNDLKFEDPNELARTFKLFLQQIGTQSTDQTVNQFVDAVQKTIQSQPTKKMEETLVSVGNFMNTLKARKKENSGLDTSSEKLKIEIPDTTSIHDSGNSYISSSIRRGSRSKVNYFQIAQQQTTRAAQAKTMNFPSRFSIDDKIIIQGPKMVFTQGKINASQIGNSQSENSQPKDTPKLSTEPNFQEIQLQKTESPLRNESVSDSQKPIVSLQEKNEQKQMGRFKQKQVLEEFSDLEGSDSFEKNSIINTTEEEIKNVVVQKTAKKVIKAAAQKEAEKVYVQIENISQANEIYPVVIENKTYYLKLQFKDNAFQQASQLIEQYNINKLHLQSVMNQIQTQLINRKLTKPVLKLKQKQDLQKMKSISKHKQIEKKILFKTNVQIKNKKFEVAFREGDNILQLAKMHCKMFGEKDVDTVVVQLQKGFSQYQLENQK